VLHEEVPEISSQKKSDEDYPEDEEEEEEDYSKFDKLFED
jgi:hypothetical protein